MRELRKEPWENERFLMSPKVPPITSLKAFTNQEGQKSKEPVISWTADSILSVSAWESGLKESKNGPDCVNRTLKFLLAAKWKPTFGEEARLYLK